MVTWLCAGLGLLLLGGSRPRLTERPLRSVSASVSVSSFASASLLLDLVGAVLESGAAVSAALQSVGSGVTTQRPDDVAGRLVRVGRLLELGADPQTAWAACAGLPELDDAARAGVRCSESGARLAAALRGVAADLRRRSRDEALARANKLGVWAMLPLGLCFLPAFVCLGIVPVVYGIAQHSLLP